MWEFIYFKNFFVHKYKYKYTEIISIWLFEQKVTHEASYHFILYFVFIYLSKIFYLFILELGKEGETEGEKHQCVVVSCVPSTGDLAHNPGTCPRLGIELVTL